MSQPKVQLVDPQGNMSVTGLSAVGVITATSFDGVSNSSATGLTGTPELNLGIVTATSFVGQGDGHAAGLSGTPELNLGVTTATSFVGDAVGKAAGLTGTPNLNVGLITATSFVGFVTGDVTGNISGLAASITPGSNLGVGVCTAIQYHGDGSGLIGAGSSAYIAQNITASGDETIIDLSYGNLIYLTQNTDGAQTTVGFASTSAAEQITIIRNPDTDSSVDWNISYSTGGVDFDGTDDRLDTTLSTAPGTSDFTLEYWVKQDTLTDWQTHFATTRGGGGFNVGTDASGDFVFFTSAAGGRQIEVIGAITTGVWYHWAFVRYNGVTTGYINGVAKGSFSDSINYSATTASIGNLVGENSEYTNGVISNLRLVVGTAIYTADFTPPSSALTSVTNTVLLCCQSTTDDTAVTTGNALSATSSPTAGAHTIATSGSTAVGAYTITWPDRVKWNNNTTPTLISNKASSAFQIFHLTTVDTGLNYNAWEEMQSDNTYGQLWGWGGNTYGQLGQNTSGANSKYSSPVQIPGTYSIASFVSGTYMSTGLKSDGTLWAWGNNGRGQLGQNHRDDRSSPVQIPGTWSSTNMGASGGDTMTFGIKTDNTYWVWGYSNTGTLGLNVGGNVNISSPTQLPGSWSDGGPLSGNSAFGIKTDGTFWVWGRHNKGQLGLNQNAGNPARISSPTQLPGTTWTNKICGLDDSWMGIKSDGTLWGLGSDYGNLALNSQTLYSSPTQVGTDTTWKDIATSYTAGLATKTDGTLWAWGDNGEGQLGQSDKVTRSSPIQVGTDTTWDIPLTNASSVSMALKTDGTLWSWGSNSYGQLGLSQAAPTRYSSPIQVPGTYLAGDVRGSIKYNIGGPLVMRP